MLHKFDIALVFGFLTIVVALLTVVKYTFSPRQNQKGNDTEAPKADIHLKTVAFLNIIYASTGLFLFTILYYLSTNTPFDPLATSAERINKETLLYMLQPFMIATQLLLIIQLIAACAIIKRITAAKYALIVTSVLLMLNIPLGTLLGIYTLWVLVFRKDANNDSEDLSKAEKKARSINRLPM